MIRKKYNLHKTLMQVLSKYCSGDYGFDQQLARDGNFQLAVARLLATLAAEFSVYLFFLQSRIELLLAQMLEEAVIFIYEDATQGELLQHQPLI